MVKILMGLAAVVVIAVGGFFGFEFYTQHRITSDVEAAFAQIRAGGGKASHGKVSFDLKSRTLRIADIATELATQPPVRMKIAGVTAAGVGQPDAGRFSADSIEASDIEIGANIAGPAGGNLSYKMPRVVMKDYSGPASLQRPPAPASVIEMYRSALEQFAAVSAASVSVPSITGTDQLRRRHVGRVRLFGHGPAGHQGRQDRRHAGRTSQLYGQHATGRQGRQNDRRDRQSQLRAISMPTRLPRSSIRRRPMTTAITRFYGKTSAGPYTVTSALGLRMRIDQMTIDGVGARPSRLQLPALLAMIQAAGATSPTPAQTREMIDKMAALLRGHADRNGRDARPFGRNTARPGQAPAIRFNLEDGKIGEFAVEGLDTNTPKGPVKLGRFALKSLDIANFMRISAQFANPAQPPSPELIAGLFPLIEGVEIKGVTAPFKNTGKFVNLDGFDLNWGQFVGPIPSKARLTAKMTTPVDATDPSMKALIAAGLDTLSADG